MCIFMQMYLYVAELPLELDSGGFAIHLNHHRSQNVTRLRGEAPRHHFPGASG